MTGADGNGRLGRMGRCALTYARHGWVVYPQDQDKRAFVRWGELEQPPDHETVARWWRRWPEANIACVCGPSGLVVVDADGELGEAGLEALGQFYGAWPDTLEVQTGRGRHLYFRAPEGFRASGGRPGELVAGVDVRAGRLSATLPPSLHRSGARYEWREGGAGMAPAPAWLVERLAARARPRPAPAPARPLRTPGADGTPYGLAALRGILERLAAASHPGRRDALNVAALHVGHLVAGGELSAARAEQELLEVGALIFGHGPPPEAQEVERTVREGLADGMRDPRSAPQQEARVAGPGLRVNLRTRLETNLRGGAR